MDIISKIVDLTVADYREKKFTVEDIFDEVWDNPSIEERIVELSKVLPSRKLPWGRGRGTLQRRPSSWTCWPKISYHVSVWKIGK